jgi:hypothetical protein
MTLGGSMLNASIAAKYGKTKGMGDQQELAAPPVRTMSTSLARKWSTM